MLSPWELNLTAANRTSFRGDLTEAVLAAMSVATSTAVTEFTKWHTVEKRVERRALDALRTVNRDSMDWDARTTTARATQLLPTLGLPQYVADAVGDTLYKL